MDADSLRRQLHGHLHSLQLAGVEWLPLGPPLEMPHGVDEAPSGAARSEPNQDRAETRVPMPSTSVCGGDDLAFRRQELATLAELVAGCTRCKQLASTRTQTVFADGQVGAELCFIGEAPGADEDAQGLPFVGAAGKLLTRIIEAMGMKREEVYICNTIKCRPPGNRTPLPDETANCREFFDRQLELVQPKFICCLGRTAAANLLGTTRSLGELRGKFHDYKGIQVIVTYHPAYLLPHRSPEKKKDVWEDMKMLLAKMGRPLPSK